MTILDYVDTMGDVASWPFVAFVVGVAALINPTHYTSWTVLATGVIVLIKSIYDLLCISAHPR